MKLRYRPRRVGCPRCGVRVEAFAWAEPWVRVTLALAQAVATRARGAAPPQMDGFGNAIQTATV